MASWRRPVVDPALPAWLVSFRLTEWPDAECPHEAVRMWEHACMDWLAADSNRAHPVGDCLDLMREALRLHGSFPPCPAEFRPARWVGEQRPGLRHV
jgi:hypothetical protein